MRRRETPTPSDQEDAMSRDTVREYYEAVHDHDWAKLASTLSPDMVRMGIRSDFDEDTVAGREPYVRFVEQVIGTFEHHAMEVIGIFYFAGRPVRLRSDGGDAAAAGRGAGAAALPEVA
jgi:hypothetical protein